MKLKNKVAFITGGSSGIGLETAKLFQAEGANIVLVGSNEEHLAEAGKALDGKALLVRADLRNVAEIEQAVEDTRARFGHIDVVFANAGATTVAPLEAVTEAYLADNLALNFTGTFFTIQKTAAIIPKGEASSSLPRSSTRSAIRAYRYWPRPRRRPGPLSVPWVRNWRRAASV